MSEGFFTIIGALIGFLGAVVTAKIGRNKDLTESDIKSAIEGADRQVYRDVEMLNRQLKKEISAENIAHQNKWEQKKIDADIISKSRMHWIDSTKIIMTRFISNALELSAANVMFNQKIVQHNQNLAVINAAKKASETTSLTKRERKEAQSVVTDWEERGSEVFDVDMKERVDRINFLTKEVYQDFILIKLNFSDNEENNKIVNLSFEINEELRKFSLSNGWNQFSSLEELQKAVNKAISIRNSNSRKVESLADLLREYYKKEWEKVKVGE